MQAILSGRIANTIVETKPTRKRMTRSANPSVDMVKIRAVNPQGGRYQKPKIGDLDECRERSVDSAPAH